MTRQRDDSDDGGRRSSQEELVDESPWTYRALWGRLKSLTRRGSKDLRRPRTESSCALLFAEIFQHCFGYLDGVALLQCEAVCKEWHVLLQDPYIWEQFYCNSWRNGCSLPSGMRTTVQKKLKFACQQRRCLEVELSTRAKMWTRRSGNRVVHNDSLYRNFFEGCVESVRSEAPLEPLALSLVLGDRLCYFEAVIHGCGSIGLVSVSRPGERLAYGFGSESHVGWYPVSYGYHGDNGHIYWSGESAPLGGYEVEYGPTWGDVSSLRRRKSEGVVVGCGYHMDRSQVFFTVNGQFIGMVDVSVVASRQYAAAVSLHQMGDSAELNFGRTAFVFDVEHYLWACSPETCPAVGAAA
ncbi:TPA: hypothetical protein N0F65_000408 [Lagenidium giganteum]|uniref:F-box protein n=1 Tax=Lagenidium giganteum TaxID=4803 RepID=A0AAV2Z3S8_9STRA|nr:TPA: hypothetical protein N0F65_000408 [Lagenidium giganteum]